MMQRLEEIQKTEVGCASMHADLTINWYVYSFSQQTMSEEIINMHVPPLSEMFSRPSERGSESLGRRKSRCIKPRTILWIGKSSERTSWPV